MRCINKFVNMCKLISTLVIAQFPAQYDQYFPRFSDFENLFAELTTKYANVRKYWLYCTLETLDN